VLPFLKQGLIMATFNLSGNTPECRIALQIYVKGVIINGTLRFIILLEISPYPEESLVFILFIIFSISCVEAYCQLILVKGLLNKSKIYTLADSCFDLTFTLKIATAMCAKMEQLQRTVQLSPRSQC
jgi:hypothetical protein